MKLNELLIVVLLWVASIAGAFWFGMDHKGAVDQAKKAEVKQAIEDTRKAANEGAADAISKIIVRNTTVQGRVETIVRDNPVYRDCSHDDATLRLLNSALTGRASGAGPTGNGSLPGTDTTH
jgi:hypothetical protein